MMDEGEDEEMPLVPLRTPTDSASETDDDVMNESGTEASDSQDHANLKINGISRA